MVAEVLPEPDVLLREHRCRQVIANPYTTSGSRRYMNECRTGSQTEINTTLCTTDVNIFNVRTLREMLYVCSTIENGVNAGDEIAGHSCDVLCHIALEDEDTRAEEFIETAAEIVEQQVAYTSFGIFLTLAAHKTCDGLGIGVDQLFQNMDTQITRCTGE